MRLAWLWILCSCLSPFVWSQEVPDISFIPPEIPHTQSLLQLPPTDFDHEFVLELRHPTGTLKEGLEQIRLHSGDSQIDPGLLGRFYEQALHDSQDAALFGWPLDALSGGGHFDQRQNQWLQNVNSPQMQSILQSSLTHSVVQEVLGVRDGSPFLAPLPNSQEDFQRRLQSGFDVSFGVDSGGISGRLNWRLFGVQLSAAVAPQSGGLQPVSLSIPFLGRDTRGELGVNSHGDAWLYFMTRW